MLCGILAVVNAPLMNFNALNELSKNFGGQFVNIRVSIENLEETPRIDSFFGVAFNFLLKIPYSALILHGV